MSPLDTTQTIETPEGVEFEVHLAGPLTRMLAAGIDLCIRGLLCLALAIPLGVLGKTGAGILLVLVFIVEWAYPIYFEMYQNGATPGKKFFDLHVTMADGTPVDWHGSVLRNLLRTADFLPAGYALGIIVMAVTGRFQRLGDLAGDTVVCYRHRMPFRLASLDTLPDPDPVATARQLSVEEQKAIVQFAARSKGWNYTRNAELAGYLEPLTGTANHRDGITRLQGLANWIMRGR